MLIVMLVFSRCHVCTSNSN